MKERRVAEILDDLEGGCRLFTWGVSQEGYHAMIDYPQGSQKWQAEGFFVSEIEAIEATYALLRIDYPNGFNDDLPFSGEVNDPAWDDECEGQK